MALVLGGVGLFWLLLSPLQKPRTPSPRPLQSAAGGAASSERPNTGALQPSWKSARSAAAAAAASAAAPGADAGAR
jgi:hypothetical protein